MEYFIFSTDTLKNNNTLEKVEFTNENDEHEVDMNPSLYMGERRLVRVEKETLEDLPPCKELNNVLHMKSVGFLDDSLGKENTQEQDEVVAKTTFDSKIQFSLLDDLESNEEKIATQLVDEALLEAQKTLSSEENVKSKNVELLKDTDSIKQETIVEDAKMVYQGISELENEEQKYDDSGVERDVSRKIRLMTDNNELTHDAEAQNNKMTLEDVMEQMDQKEIVEEGELGTHQQQELSQPSLEEEVEDAMKDSKPEVVTEETTLTSSDGKINDTRVVMKKKIHKKTIVRDGKEETLVTTDTHIEHDDKGPEDLQAAMKEIIDNFVEGTGEFSSEPYQKE
jgi:precorrin isomerase